MSNSITPFIYDEHPVRVVDIAGNPWFVASDVLTILEVDRTSLRRLDDDEKGVDSIHTPGGEQQVNVVSEAGLYSLILGSRKPEARMFKRFVTHDILPSIRRHGGYLTPEATEEALLNPDFVIRLATELKAERAARAELAAANQQQGARLRLVEPKAAAFDRWLSSNVDYSVTHVANALHIAGADVGRNRLFGRMYNLHWIYRGDANQWTPYQTQVETGRLAVKLGTQLNTRTGEQFATVTLRVTPKGVAKLATIYGVMPEAVAEALATTEEDAA